MLDILSRDKWYLVAAPELAVFKTDEEQALFQRNQDRLLVRSDKYQTRLREKRLDIAGEPLKYTSNGSGRRLLSGVIKCMACGSFHYGYFGPIMRCGGATRSGCSNHLRIDADKTTSIVLTKLQQEISDDNSLRAYEKEIRERASETTRDLSGSVKDAEVELKRLKEELMSLIRERATKSGSVRETYDDAIAELESSIATIDRELRSSRHRSTGRSENSIRSAELHKCRSLLERLRDPKAYSSKHEDDLYIIEVGRNMIKGRLERNEHDYGASITVVVF